MRNIPVVARRDLAAYFHSPAGPAIAALFLTLQGLVIWMFIQFLGRPDAPPGGVMEFFFGGTILFWIAIAALATVVPMRLIAEERRTGTIETLLTAPVTAPDVVVGKWLAALGFYLALWSPTLLYLVFLRAVGAPLDPGPIAAGYLGTILIGGAALALGLFASSLTRNQIVAATLSFVSFFVVLLLGAVEGQVGDPRLAAILHRLSLFRIMEDFGHGIVDSRHVVLLVTAAALGLVGATRSIAALKGRAGVATPVLSLAIALMANYVAGRHYLRGDWTRAGLYAVSDKTISVLRSLPRPVEVYVFLYPRRDSERARAVSGMVHELCDRFTRYAPERFHAEFIDPDRSPARAETMQKKYGVGAYEMGQGVVIFASGGQSKVLTRDDLVDYDLEGEMDGEPGGHLRAWKGEPAFVSALLTVSSDHPPTLCFTKGHGEPDLESFADGGYGTFAEELRRDAYQLRTVDPPALASVGPPADCAVLVIAEPQQAYSEAELAALDRHLTAGGRLLLMMGPVFNHDASGFARVGLESLARRWGIAIGDNLVVDPAHASDIEGPSVWMTSDYGTAGGGSSDAAAPLGGILTRLGGRATVWPRTREVRALPTAPDAGGATARWSRELVHCSEAGWGESDLGTIRGEADLTFDKERDVKGPVPVAVAVTARAATAPPVGSARPPGDSRLVVLGTGRLIMNYRLAGALVRDYDRDFVLSVVAWLADREERSGVAAKVPDQVRLTLEQGTVTRAFQLFVIGMPAACLVLAALVWFRRRV